MKISELNPSPQKRETFRRDRVRYVPEAPGCYVLTSFENEVLYIGLSKSLRKRKNEHLDSPSKIAPTTKGRAIFFYWIESQEIEKIERTWMNIHMLYEGELPVLNKVYSPTHT